MREVLYFIALYIRLSVEDSKVDSLSIENQKSALHKFVDTMEDVRNVTVQEFVDNGYSGTNFERPAVQELLEMVREGKVNCIIVKDFSRFGRNSIEVGYFMERVFPLYGVRFISINDEFDTAALHGDTGGIDVAFKYLISEFYSRDLSIKSRSALQVKMKRGEYQSVLCPYGYRKGENGRLEPDEETAPNVRLIFELAGNGYDSGQISRELLARGIPTPGEYKAKNRAFPYDVSNARHIWQSATIRLILRDERYAGTYVAGKHHVIEVGGHRSTLKDSSQWVKIPDHHTPIVSRELFDQVQSQMTCKKNGKRKQLVYPLRAKVTCGCCKHKMHRTMHKSPLFLCGHTQIDKSAPCYRLSIPETELESLVYESLSKQAQIILNLGDLSQAGLLEVGLSKQEEYNGRMRECQDKKRSLYEQLLLREISLEEYQEQKAAVDKELMRVKQGYTAACAETEALQAENQVCQARRDLARKVTSEGKLTPELADALIEQVYIYPGNKVEIVWKMRDFCVED